MNQELPDRDINIATPVGFWNEKRLLYLEVVLICILAVGASFLRSIFMALRFPVANVASGAETGVLSWFYKLLQNAAMIGLVWYVLLRRSKSFVDIGLTWRKKDVLTSIGLWIAGGLAYKIVFETLRLVGLNQATSSASFSSVSNYLFHSSLSVATVLAVLLNPFFEELILRAYVMTELRMLTGSVLIAVSASVVVQTIPHFYQGAAAAISLMGPFLVFAIYFAKYKRILPVILAHLYVDVGAVLVYLYRTTG